MRQLNRLWIWLIAIGIVWLGLVVGWEIYQVSSGGRESFSISVTDFSRDILIPKNLETHLRSASDFLKIIGDSSYNTQIPVSFP